VRQKTLNATGPGSRDDGTAAKPCAAPAGIMLPASAAREEAE
jgi:hypothetical protein